MRLKNNTFAFVQEEHPEHIQSLIKSLPETPGVYQYFDEDEKLILLENNIWMDSIEMPLFTFPNNLPEFEKQLKSKKDFKKLI